MDTKNTKRRTLKIVPVESKVRRVAGGFVWTFTAVDPKTSQATAVELSFGWPWAPGLLRDIAAGMRD